MPVAPGPCGRVALHELCENGRKANTDDTDDADIRG